MTLKTESGFPVYGDKWNRYYMTYHFFKKDVCSKTCRFQLILRKHQPFSSRGCSLCPVKVIVYKRRDYYCIIGHLQGALVRSNERPPTRSSCRFQLWIILWFRAVSEITGSPPFATKSLKSTIISSTMRSWSQYSDFWPANQRRQLGDFLIQSGRDVLAQPKNFRGAFLTHFLVNLLSGKRSCLFW